MRMGSSLRSRHFIVRLERGEELIDSLKSFISRERAKVCCFTGHGFFSKCQIQNYFPDKHTITNQFSCDHFGTVPYLSGNITTLGREFVVTTYGVVTFDMCGQQNTLTGIISSAKVFDLELHITVFDDLSVVRSMDAITGLLPITRISNEDYGDNLKNPPSFGDSVEISLANNGDSEISMISGLSNLPQNSMPEVIHKNISSPTDNPEDKKSTSNNAEPQVEIQNLEASSSNIKRRRRVPVSQEVPKVTENKEAEVPVHNNLPEIGLQKPENISSRKRANAIQISTDDKSPIRSGENLAAKNVPILEPKGTAKPTHRSENEINSYRHRTNTFMELSGIEESDSIDFNVGDWIIHPSLGKCKIIALLKNNCIQIKTESGSTKDISLSYFNMIRVDDIQNKSCFKLESR